MSSTTLHSQTFTPAKPLNAGKVLRQFATAAARFVGGIAFALRRPVRQNRRLSLVEEANELRAYAAQFQQQDPHFAADLFAAADRHESGGVA